MRLLYFLDSLGSGGAQRQVVELARHLRRDHGVDVSVATYHEIPFYRPRLDEAGVPVVHFAKRTRFDPTLPWRLRRWILENGPDVVHAFLLQPGLWCLAGHQLVPAARRPVFLAAERSAQVAASAKKTWMQRALYGHADALTANAAPVAEEISRKLGVPAGRVHYLPNGIDLADWDRAAAAPCPIALEPDRFHLALVGGLRVE
jgi:glycosyltransferase involved in cell wall biosynthesis